MNTQKVIIIGVLTLSSISLFAQRNSGTRVERTRNDERHERVVTNYRPSNETHYGRARSTVIITPQRPRVVIEPRIVIGVNTCKPNRCAISKPSHLCHQDMQRAHNRLQSMSFDRDKVNYIKDVLDYNYVTTDQLCSMLDYISFDSNRLDIAKYAYTKTIDSENYDMVYSMLDFNSSKRELDRYIDRQNYCSR